MKRWFALSLLLSLINCSSDITDDAIPFTSFEPKFINLNLPEYIRLRTDGGFIYIHDIGVRGVILYRLNSNIYYAFERNCSYQPNSACATVEVDASTLFMLDACCSSTFEFATGSPTGGVASRPLRRYETLLSGSTLTITPEVVN